jgi:UDP-N-acetylglucosamine 2-epimerase (hydrolysing)
MRRSLLFVTGTRADFGKLEPLATRARDAGFDVTFFVTGMHMLESYGLTRLEVSRVQGVRVHEHVNQQEGDPQDLVLASTVTGFSAYVSANKPDLIVLHGDRVEALACALVAATNYIRSAHVEGGEVSGTIDEIFRHCNSKLAYCHFVSSTQAAQRVRSLGEPDELIFTIGSPELDFHARSSGVSIEEVRQHYEIPFEDYGICIFHPVTSEAGNMKAQAISLYRALRDSKRHFVLILPNNDPGSSDIIDVINTMPPARFRIIPSMRFSYFSELMKNASALVGNSSAGVREAPFLGIPSLDVGSRQTDRSLSPSVSACDALNSDAILEFLNTQWGAKFSPHTGYGEGQAASRFVQTLSEESFWQHSMQKRFRDL